jgi:hypothetical protein
MARLTSVLAYNAVRTSGLLGDVQKQVYELFYDHGPLTANELWTYYLKEKYGQRSITPVTAPLRDLGLIYEVRNRKCRVTNMTVIEWDVTKNLPPTVRPKIDKSTCKKCPVLELRIKELEATIESMKPKPKPPAATDAPPKMRQGLLF